MKRLVAVALLGTAMLGACRTKPPKPLIAAPPPPMTTEASLHRGLQRLAAGQNADGSWGADYQVAVTSLTVLAFLSNNVLDTSVQRGVAYLRACTKGSATGFIGEPNGSRSRMHGHGFAVQALAEWALRGGKGDAELANALQLAVAVSEKSQTANGGWGYLPDPNNPDDLTVSVAQVQGLATAKAAGAKVSDGVLARGVEYLKKCATTDQGFKYGLSGGAGGTVALTAGGVSSLYLLGADDLPEIEQGLSYMSGRQHDPAVREKESGYYYYATYYATLAWSHKGGIQWNDWWSKVSGEIAARQHADGGWSGPYDPNLCTAFACLVLSAPRKELAVWRE